MYKKNKVQFNKYITLTLIVLISIIIWGTSPFFIKSYLSVFGDTQKIDWKLIASIGDSFGSINSLFSAFAFIGLIVTIRQQKEESNRQKEIDKKEQQERNTDQAISLCKDNFQNYQIFKKLTFSATQECNKQIEVLKKAIDKFKENEHELIPIYKSPSPHLDILSKEIINFDILKKYPHNHKNSHEFIIEIKSLNSELIQYEKYTKKYRDKCLKQHTIVQEIDNELQTILLEQKIVLTKYIKEIKINLGTYLEINIDEIEEFLNLYSSPILINEKEQKRKEYFLNKFKEKIKPTNSKYQNFINSIAILQEQLNIINIFHNKREKALNDKIYPSLVDKKKFLYESYIYIYNSLFNTHNTRGIDVNDKIASILTKSRNIIYQIESMKEQNNYLSKEIKSMISVLEKGIENLYANQLFLEKEEKICEKDLNHFLEKKEKLNKN